MSATERRYVKLTPDQAADEWERREAALLLGIERTLNIELPELALYAKAALDRKVERFASERNIAHTVIEIDIPQRRRWLHAAHALLSQGNWRERFDFTFEPKSRNNIIQKILSDGGFVDENGHWMEISA
jgi:hypothetical protein